MENFLRKKSRKKRERNIFWHVNLPLWIFLAKEVSCGRGFERVFVGYLQDIGTGQVQWPQTILWQMLPTLPWSWIPLSASSVSVELYRSQLCPTVQDKLSGLSV